MKSWNKEIVEKLGEYEDIVFIYGLPNVGKSLFLLQESYYQLSQGYSVLWIDTEGGIDEMMKVWSDKLKKRYGVKKDIRVVKIRSFSSFMKYLGKNVEVSASNKGKITIQLKGESKKKDGIRIFDVVRDKTLVVVDSFTAPFRLAIPSSTENLPARSDAYALAVESLFRLMDSRDDVVVMMSVHSSFTPTNPFEVKHGYVGGMVLKYFSKRIMFIEKPRKNKLSDYRKLWFMRSPRCKEWGEYSWMKITDEGYIEVDEKEVEEVLEK